MADHREKQSSQPSTITSKRAVNTAKRQELKRQQGKISCAECHRVKLKCDRKIPCSSCVRRGCVSICPTGKFLGGQNSRHLLVELSLMQHKIDEMGNRIHELEEALKASHAKNSHVQHPLLAENLLSIKSSAVDTSQHNVEEESDDTLDGETMAAFGKLSISEDATELLGLPLVKQVHISITKPSQPTGNDEHTNLRNDGFTYLTTEIARLASSWPFSSDIPTISPENLTTQVAHCLPSWERATALCEAYLENRAWLLRAIDREQLVEEVMPMVYGRKKPTASTPRDEISPIPSNPFQPPLAFLPLLLSVFAVGASADFTLPEPNTEAESYFNLACAGLRVLRGSGKDEHVCRGVGDCGGSGRVTLETVQTLSLLGLYCKFAERTTARVSTGYWNVAYVLAGTISLHRDPAHWDLPPKSIQRRRSLFWELYTINSWHSFAFRRPTIFCFHSTDCELPADTTAPEHEGSIGFHRWKHLFAKEVLGPISEEMCVASAMKYSTILDMDRRIQKFRVQHRRGSPRTDGSYSELMHAMVAVAYPEMISLIVHRNFFARALLEHPANPLASPFATSFMATYHSATTITKLLREQFELHKMWAERMWFMRGASLVAIVVIACVVMRTPKSELAPSAFVELGLAKAFFERTVSHPTARQALPVITRLFERAQQALYGATANPAYEPAMANALNATTPPTMSAAPSAFVTNISYQSPFTGGSSNSLATEQGLQSVYDGSTSTSSTLPWDLGDVPNLSSSANGIFAPSWMADANDCFPFDAEMLNELEALAAKDINTISEETWRVFMGESGFVVPTDVQSHTMHTDTSPGHALR